MRCKTCDYRLWNLTSRICPECGNPFAPSDFEFIPNAVKFLCPHCGQAYYGTTAEGHLNPFAFVCVSCGQQIHMDEMVLLPADHVTEQDTAPDRCPWLERAHRGFFRSWFATIGMSMTRPLRLIRAVPLESPAGAARGLAFWNLFAPLLATLIPLFLVIGVTDPGEAFEVALAVAVGLLIYALLIALWALLTHAMLRITGGCGQTLGRTLQLFCYSSGPMIMVGVPCLGPYLLFYVCTVWWMVSAILMTKETHAVHGGRATLAVLTFPGLCLLTCVSGYAFLIYAVISGMGPFSAVQTATTLQETQLVTDALLAWQEDEASWPEHAIRLAADDYCDSWDFVTTDSATSLEFIPVANTTMDAFSGFSESRRQATATAVIEALPGDVVAHRLGDFVFTYHGIDCESGNAALWIVIMADNPGAVDGAEAAFGPEASSGLMVGKLDGTTEHIHAQDIQSKLDEQNRLRAEQGLTPLPWPSEILHGKPWTPDSKPRGPATESPFRPTMELEKSLNTQEAEPAEEEAPLP